MSSVDAFREAPYRSIKQDTYFTCYDKLLTPYIGKSPVVVDVGVLSGGSLFMWRDFFGSGARIIGVELNPTATKWRDHGFEIFIGDQSSDAFWDDFFQQVGNVDILIDDGGHTNFQQLKTLHKAIPHVRDGGVILIEDTHASYMGNFGNPSKYSFMNFCANAVHSINDRYFYKKPKNLIRDNVSSLEIFEGISAFKIDRRLCKKSSLIDNGGENDHAIDMQVGDVAMMRNALWANSKIVSKFQRKSKRVKERLLSFKNCRQFFS
ncbi:MAG: class I SAM-dependent methyltransferase [Proteobacteria bacterium]|nr:class I SAM-dependent methyltransferase [Pseudomonadota bacterium]